MKKKVSSIFALIFAVLLFTNSLTGTVLAEEAAETDSCTHPSYTVSNVRTGLYPDGEYHYEVVEMKCVCSECKATFIKSFRSEEGEKHSLTVKEYLGNDRHQGSMHYEDCIKRCAACGYECYDVVSWPCPGPPCPVRLHSTKPEEQIR